MVLKCLYSYIFFDTINCLGATRASEKQILGVFRGPFSVLNTVELRLKLEYK